MLLIPGIKSVFEGIYGQSVVFKSIPKQTLGKDVFGAEYFDCFNRIAFAVDQAIRGLLKSLISLVLYRLFHVLS